MLHHNPAHPNLSPSHILLPPSPQILLEFLLILGLLLQSRFVPYLTDLTLTGLHNASRIHDSAEERHFPVHDLHVYRQEYSCAGELTVLLFFCSISSC